MKFRAMGNNYVVNWSSSKAT